MPNFITTRHTNFGIQNIFCDDIYSVIWAIVIIQKLNFLNIKMIMLPAFVCCISINKLKINRSSYQKIQYTNMDNVIFVLTKFFVQ